MFIKEDLRETKKIIEDFFDKMTFPVEIDSIDFKDQTIFVQISSEEAQILIGEKGQTLADIQHILRAMLKRGTEDPLYIDLDINDYKKKKGEYLREMARTAADEVSLTKIEKSLPPMTAYERRIVHMELAERQDIVTESVGRDPERKTVIKPKTEI